MPKIIAVVGISGVGKSTMLKALSGHLPFQHLSAGGIIAEERARRLTQLDHDKLRLANIEDNQQLLIEGFKNSLDANARIVVLDGHTVIDTDNGLKPIQSEVFAALGIQLFVFIAADVSRIIHQREQDPSRSRPPLNPSQVEEHQSFAMDVTKNCAKSLNIPCEIINSGDIEGLKKTLSICHELPPGSAPNSAI